MVSLCQSSLNFVNGTLESSEAKYASLNFLHSAFKSCKSAEVLLKSGCQLTNGSINCLLNLTSEHFLVLLSLGMKVSKISLGCLQLLNLGAETPMPLIKQRRLLVMICLYCLSTVFYPCAVVFQFVVMLDQFVLEVRDRLLHEAVSLFQLLASLLCYLLNELDRRHDSLHLQMKLLNLSQLLSHLEHLIVQLLVGSLYRQQVGLASHHLLPQAWHLFNNWTHDLVHHLFNSCIIYEIGISLCSVAVGVTCSGLLGLFLAHEYLMCSLQNFQFFLILAATRSSSWTPRCRPSKPCASRSGRLRSRLLVIAVHFNTVYID